MLLAETYVGIFLQLLLTVRQLLLWSIGRYCRLLSGVSSSGHTRRRQESAHDAAFAAAESGLLACLIGRSTN